MKPRHYALTLILLLVSTGVVRANLFLPAGLNPGDEYRIAFVTSGERDATSADIDDYNSFVNMAANVPGTLTASLNTTWTAIMSINVGAPGFIDARDNTGTNPDLETGVPIFLVDGLTLLASDNADLWDETVGSPLSLDETGATLVTEVWTGTNADGLSASAPPAQVVPVGLSDFADEEWIDSRTRFATADRSLYGISAELTAVPLPSAFWLMVVSLSAMGAFFRARI